MNDILGKKLEIGQTVAYVNNKSARTLRADLRSGIVVKSDKQSTNTIVSIISNSNNVIQRGSWEVAVLEDPKPSRSEFLEGENHNG